MGDERRQKAHRHDQPEGAFTDAVLVAELVEDGEHHAVSGCEQGRERAEDDDDGPGTHPASIAEEPSTLPDV